MGSKEGVNSGDRYPQRVGIEFPSFVSDGRRDEVLELFADAGGAHELPPRPALMASGIEPQQAATVARWLLAIPPRLLWEVFAYAAVATFGVTFAKEFTKGFAGEAGKDLYHRFKKLCTKAAQLEPEGATSAREFIITSSDPNSEDQPPAITIVGRVTQAEGILDLLLPLLSSSEVGERDVEVLVLEHDVAQGVFVFWFAHCHCSIRIDRTRQEFALEASPQVVGNYDLAVPYAVCAALRRASFVEVSSED